MNRIITKPPLENLYEFEDLKTLIIHILNSLEIKSIKILLPSNYKAKLIPLPDTIFPVNEMEIGKATFKYLYHRIDHIISNVDKLIKKVNENDKMSLMEKIELFESLRRSILVHYKYFDSSNLIRYMTGHKWIIVLKKKQKGHDVISEFQMPNTKLDLRQEDWNIIENNFTIRKNILHELLFQLETEREKLQSELGNTKYRWKGEDWQLELYEIILPLLFSDKIEFIRGDEKTFIHNFLALFGKSDEKYTYYKDKILTRKNRAKFLVRLENILTTHGKSKKTNTG